jgi:hypothetical protein
MKALLFAVVLVLTVLLASRAARAETLQAPVAGKAISLGDGRVVCPGTSGDWAVEQEGRAVRPPATDDSVGKATEARVAASTAACATSSAPVTLVVTGRWPTIDAGGSSLFVDDARVELHGRNLRGVIVHWQLGDRTGEDRCVQPQTDTTGEKCAVAVGRGLPADPGVADLWWLPAGSRSGPDVATADATGRRVALDELLLRPGRLVVSSLLPADVSIDLAGGTASRIPLVHPEAVANADCGATSCAVSGGVIVVGGLSTVSGSLSVRLRLVPRVVLLRGDVADAAPVVQVPVLPCAMTVASGDALRGVDATRVVVRVDARCAGEARTLRWFSAGRALELLDAVDAAGATFVLLGLGRVEGDEVVVTASRGGADGSTVGQARARTRPLPPLHTALSIDGGEPIDFVPTNRPATVQWARSPGGGELALLPLDGVYDVTVRDGATLVQGQKGAGGNVALHFAWRSPSLPGGLATADLALVSDSVQHPMHEASVPVPLGAATTGVQPVIEMLCGAGAATVRAIPGAVTHIPFDERDSCRLVFHRERLSPGDGPQHLQLDVDITRVDGEARPEAHVSQMLVLRASDEPRFAWVKGVAGQFDRATLRLSYSGEGSSRSSQEEPSAQWSIVFGTGNFRLYGTTAIPTGLYRVSDPAHSGILTLNFGVIMRATWLDSQGHEGFLGLEGGVLAEGLANDKENNGDAATQVATVAGIGLSVPIANRSLATETSINLHAWMEYEVSRGPAGELGNPLGFVFGPSISIGNIGTNF